MYSASQAYSVRIYRFRQLPGHLNLTLCRGVWLRRLLASHAQARDLNSFQLPLSFFPSSPCATTQAVCIITELVVVLVFAVGSSLQHQDTFYTSCVFYHRACRRRGPQLASVVFQISKSTQPSQQCHRPDTAYLKSGRIGVFSEMLKDNWVRNTCCGTHSQSCLIDHVV